MDKLCKKCGEQKKYLFLRLYRTNSIHVDEHGRKWKNSKTCPTCFAKYNTQKTKERRNNQS
jgi:hypothetical protein